MTKKQNEMNIELAVNYAEEIKLMASSLCEDVKDATCMVDAWNKIDKFYRDVESMRNRQKCTGSKSFSIMQGDIEEGHTKYLQGIDLPIMVNSIFVDENNCKPSPVCEMHIGKVDDKLTLLITPKDIILPN